MTFVSCSAVQVAASCQQVSSTVRSARQILSLDDTDEACPAPSMPVRKAVTTNHSHKQTCSANHHHLSPQHRFTISTINLKICTKRSNCARSTFSHSLFRFSHCTLCLSLTSVYLTFNPIILINSVKDARGAVIRVVRFGS
jgi:hypothetical protein